METVRIYRLQPTKKLFAVLRDAQMEAAKVWNLCCEIHKQARMDHTQWLGRNELQEATKGGQFALHSQAVQMVVHAFLANIDTTRKLRQMIVTGRGIRSLKRQRTKMLGKLAKKQSRCKKHSRRWRRLQWAKNKQCRRTERRIRDLRHKATRKVIDFCQEQNVGSLFVGNPHGVRNQDRGRYHNQRMSLWEYGKDIDYLTHKSAQACIKCFTGSERGTSSQCPVCKHKHKPKGRNWACRKCGFTGHRDIVGSVNMHPLAFSEQVSFPRSITYLRPGLSRSSRRADTPLASNDACSHGSTTALGAGFYGNRPHRWRMLEAHPF